MWTVNFQMFKLNSEKAEEPEIKLPTCAGSSKKQEFLKNIYFCFIDQSLWLHGSYKLWKFCWLSGEESALQCKRHWFDPRIGKISCRRKWQPTPIVLPGKSHGQRNLATCSPWGWKRVGQNWVTKQQQITLILCCIYLINFDHPTTVIE